MHDNADDSAVDNISSTADRPEFDNLPLREKLKKKRVPVDDINRFLAYVMGEKQKEQGKDKKPVTNNSDDMLYVLFVKYWNLGLVIDGVNVVITGRAMAMVTYHGYKNKVRQSYPNARFDIQLVRQGDTFKVGKDTGRVKYTHEIGNPFENTDIEGAYVLIRIGSNDYFEALNKRDYEEMRKASKQSFLWDKWESEFWLKSVMKRACKRHFYDEVKEIDKLDNELYGSADDVSADEKIDKALSERDKNRITIDDEPAAKATATPKPNAGQPAQKLY